MEQSIAESKAVCKEFEGVNTNLLRLVNALNALDFRVLKVENNGLEFNVQCRFQERSDVCKTR